MASGCHNGKQRDSFRLSSVLTSAVSEWFLMLLLFLHALFSFLVTKFARLFKLQTPCLLCSRLDHVLGDEKPGFYWNLICSSHKSEISSLAYCHVHQKLADVNVMCKGCLLSFATEMKSNPETYRSLVGKLSIDLDDYIDGDGFQNKLNGEDIVELPLLTKHPVSGSLVTKHCSCCSVPFRNKSHAVSLLQNNLIRVEDGEFDMSLSNSTGHSHIHHQDRLSEKRKNSLGSPLTHHLGNHGFDRLSRVGYSEVKVTSDSESETSFSDDDGGNRLAEDLNKDPADRFDIKEDLADRCLKPEPTTSIPNYLSMPQSDDTVIEKLIHPASSKHDSPLSIPEDQQFHFGESRDVSLASTVAIGHHLEEINWNKVGQRVDPPALSENISQNGPSEFSDAKLNDSDNCNAQPSTTSMEHSKPLSSTDADIVTSQATRDHVPSGPIHMDLNDAYRLATGGKRSLPSPTVPTVSEVISGRDSLKAYEDIRLLISQFSAARGLDSPWNELSPSPRVQGQGDDIKFSDASSSAILQNITKGLSIERNASGLESLDGSIVNEIEGESPMERLKRQVELDRKSMYLLYKELEEERSASAIAANQAMAMITRLQEEKAAMQMEALQYQRMMEEQSEYDQEALQKLNELLIQSEKEIQVLEAEVESYRKRFGDKLMADNAQEPSGDSQAAECDTASMKKSRVSNEFEQRNSDISVSPFLGFEDDKAYISECLKKLETKLHIFSNNGMHVAIFRDDMEEDGHLDKSCSDENGENSEQQNGLHSEMTTRNSDLERPHWDDQEHGLTGGEILSDKDLSPYGEDSSAKTSASSLLEGPININHKETLVASDSNNDSHYSMDCKSCNLTALLDEVSQLNERLKALEADRNFLEHTVNTLRNGNDGIQFIQEIACHLQELRKIGITLGEHSVA